MVVRIIIIVGAVNKQANGTSTSDPLHHPSSAPMDSLTVLFQYHGHTHPSLPQHLCVSLHICSWSVLSLEGPSLSYSLLLLKKTVCVMWVHTVQLHVVKESTVNHANNFIYVAILK